MRDFIGILHEATKSHWRQEEEKSSTISPCPDDETFHLQADGFWGEEKGFHDAEELRHQ